MSHFPPLATYFTTILCKRFCTWPSFFFFLSFLHAEWAPVPITAACWPSGTVSTPSFFPVSTQTPVALCPSLLILLNKRNQHPQKATQQPIERYNRNCSNCVRKWSRILQINLRLNDNIFVSKFGSFDYHWLAIECLSGHVSLEHFEWNELFDQQKEKLKH